MLDRSGYDWTLRGHQHFSKILKKILRNFRDVIPDSFNWSNSIAMNTRRALTKINLRKCLIWFGILSYFYDLSLPDILNAFSNFWREHSNICQDSFSYDKRIRKISIKMDGFNWLSFFSELDGGRKRSASRGFDLTFKILWSSPKTLYTRSGNCWRFRQEFMRS